MKPLITHKVEIYHCGVLLILEIEEYKSVYNVHFIDRRKYFSHLDTISFKKFKGLTIQSISYSCYHYALDKRFF